MALKIELLGRPRITRNGRPVDLPGYRPLALLAYLVLTRKAYRREYLIDLLFDGPDDPRASLRWTLSKLRKSIGSEYILADQQEIAFNFQGDYWLDVAAFEAGEAELYQGDFLEGLSLRDAPGFEDWLSFERQQLRGKHQAHLEEQLEDYKNRGDHAAVILTAQQLLKLDNLREDWHYALIDGYAGLGKRAAALEQFERCRRMLRKEWGLDPSPETLALAETIQSERNGAEIAPITGEHRITGGTTPAVEPVVMQAASQEDCPRQGPSQSTKIMIAMTSLVLALVLFISYFIYIYINDRAAASQDQRPTSPGSATRGESLPPDLAGKTVWILGPFYDAQAKLFMESMKPFEQSSGIDVVFLTGNKPYETNLKKRLESADLPDLVIFPQPSWLARLAGQRKIIDIRTFLDDDYLQKQFYEQFLKLATVDGQMLGIWHTVGLKSLVWYPKKAFEAEGYKVPKTWDELIALSDQIVADGGVPWCIGIDDYDAKGWVGTDWVEDILLRTAPPETYDAWVNHDLPFNSPQIKRVFEIMGQIWLNDRYVYGGRSTMLAENIIESPSHLFEDPPGCYLHKQASFAPFFFPPGVSYGQDYDFFYLPPIDPEFGKPVLGSGEIMAMFNDRPEVREVVRYLTTAEATKALIKRGNFLSPHRDTPLEWFPTAADLRFAEIVLSADAYRFDGSDLMPEEVGIGSFYRGITDWLQGADLETVLQEIDASWPR